MAAISSSSRRGLAKKSAIVSASFVSVLSGADAHASCNLIPVAAASYRSVQGGVISPITGPGEIVQLELNGCDPSAGFEKTAAANEITITFEPPPGSGGSTTDVVLNAFDVTLIKSTANCTLPGGRCRTLRFETPDTTGMVLPDTSVATNGLAGPARITVRDAVNNVVAEIAALNLPALSCDEEPETVFEKFTILPRANNFFDIDNGTTTQVLATVDGGNNLLVPFDYWGGGTRSVLVDRPGAPEARFLEGDAPIEAFTGGGTTIGQEIAGEPNPSAFIRSFTLSGRPLPPLLRLKTGGAGLYGAADAVASVLRIAINDGSPPDLYDVTDRLTTGGRGPIVIGSPVLNVQTPLPLRSLRSSSDSVAYTRDEARESLSLNGDGDQFDLVAQVVDAETGSVSNTQEAVTPIANSFFVAPAIAASGDIVAYLVSELGQGSGLINGDGETYDSIVRAFLRDGTNLAPSVLEDASLNRLVNGEPLAISNDKVFFRSPGARIALASPIFPGPLFDAVISANGSEAYMTVQGSLDDSCIVLAPDPDIYAGPWSQYCATGTSGAAGAAVSPDGATLYVAGAQSNNVTVYETDAPSLLGFNLVQTLSAAGDSLPILGATGVAVSPDGQFVYVASNVSDTLSVFEVTGALGEITFVESETNGLGAPVVSGLDAPEDVAISADGLHVYVASSTGDSVAVFERDTLNGEITFVESEVDGIGSVDGLDGASSVAISRDGRHVYVTGALDDAVAGFERNALTGALTFVGANFDAENALTVLDGASSVALSPDGERVYVAAPLASTLVRFRRNAATGKLLLEDTFTDTFTNSVLQPVSVAVDPVAGAYMVVVGSSGIFGHSAGFRTGHDLSVIDTGTGSLLTLRPPATRVAVSSERAAFLRPESADGVDLNGDGDPMAPGDSFDDIVQVYDATVPVTGAVTSLDVAGNRVALSASLVAFTVPEANEGNALLNDADDDDDVLHVYEIGELASAVVNVGVAADAIGVTGNSVIFITPEAGEPSSGDGCGPTIPPGGCDLSGDMDADDRVLRVYEYDPGTNSGSIVETGQPAEEFVFAGDLVAFRTPETAVGTSMNTATGDNDTNDFGMQVYDLGTDTVVSTRRSAVSCFLPGCDPNLPYKVIDLGGNRTVAFLTDERDEGAYPAGDLDLDGDADDIVLTLYNVRTAVTDTIGTVVDDASSPFPDEPEATPFPDNPFDGTLILDEVLESDIGVDVDEDGALDDVVLMVLGDSDEDGTVDDLDVCREVDQTDQADDDGDGLGDLTCDPAPPPPCPASPRIMCLTPGKASIQLKDDADPSKDSFKFKWGKGEETLVADFGNPDATLTSSYSLCVYDGSPAPQPIATGIVLPGPRICGKKPCWQDLGDKGFKFKDNDGVPLGITAVSLKPGIDGKASVQVRGKGANLGLPSLPLGTPVTVQFVVDLGVDEKCWSATFPSVQKQIGSALWQAKF